MRTPHCRNISVFVPSIPDLPPDECSHVADDRVTWYGKGHAPGMRNERDSVPGQRRPGILALEWYMAFFYVGTIHLHVYLYILRQQWFWCESRIYYKGLISVNFPPCACADTDWRSAGYMAHSGFLQSRKIQIYDNTRSWRSELRLLKWLQVICEHPGNVYSREDSDLEVNDWPYYRSKYSPLISLCSLSIKQTTKG